MQVDAGRDSRRLKAALLPASAAMAFWFIRTVSMASEKMLS
jgi:hypothetical protein